jgi:hypothetical protein
MSRVVRMLTLRFECLGIAVRSVHAPRSGCIKKFVWVFCFVNGISGARLALQLETPVYSLSRFDPQPFASACSSPVLSSPVLSYCAARERLRCEAF